MKQKFLKFGLLLLVIITAAVFNSCNDGLTQDVHNIIPDDILKNLKDLGLKINGGNKPPNVEGTYLVSPFVLVKSNFDDSWSPGYQISDMEITFYGQDNAKQTIMTDYVNAGQEGKGLGSFITGSGNKFSIFVQSEDTMYDVPFTSIQVYSGEISSAGIKNLQFATMVTVPNEYTIDRGQGRLFYDSDKLSVRIVPSELPLKIKEASSSDMLKSAASK